MAHLSTYNHIGQKRFIYLFVFRGWVVDGEAPALCLGPVGEHALRGNVGGSTDISDVQAHEKPEGSIPGKHICGGSSISGVLKLREQQWATKKQTVRKK